MMFWSEVAKSKNVYVSASALCFFLSACGAEAPTAPGKGLDLGQVSAATETEASVQLQNNETYHGNFYPDWSNANLMPNDQVFFLEVPTNKQYLKFSMARTPSCVQGRYMLMMDVGFGSIPAKETNAYAHCDDLGSGCSFVIENPAAGTWWARVWVDPAWSNWYYHTDTEFTLKGAYGGTEVLGIQVDDRGSGPSQMCLPDWRTHSRSSRRDMTSELR